MAMTAWAAKLVSKSICLSVKGRTSGRYYDSPNKLMVSEHRHCDEGANAPKFYSVNRSGMTFKVRLCRCEVRHVNSASCSHSRLNGTTGYDPRATAIASENAVGMLCAAARETRSSS